MPYRWNLDYVVDPDNNLTVYKYATETNYYLRGGATGSGTLTSYIRGGYLTNILYGWHLADATASPAVQRGRQGRVHSVAPVHGQQLRDRDGGRRTRTCRPTRSARRAPLPA